MPFTPYEYRQARSAFEVAFDLDNAGIALGQVIKATTGSKTLQANAARQLLRVQRQGSILAYALVGGIKPEAERSAQLAEAKAYRDGMLAESVVTARVALAAAGVEGADQYMTDALARLRTLDVDLLHSDPPMQPAPQVGRRTCIGPHGDYAKGQEFAHWTSHYMREWAQEWCELFESTAIDRVKAGECWALYCHLVKIQHQAGALVAGISTYWKWDNLDPFCKVLQATELLTRSDGGIGTPSVYFTLFAEWSKVSTQKPAYRQSLARLADSWLKNDGWVWHLMEFPNSTRCAVPA
jgi:hypothetical protein